jgi:HEAT repeat protein
MPEANFDSLVRQLGYLDPNNPDAQWQTAIKLGEIGDVRAVEPLIKALKSNNQALVRAHAAQAFWNLIDKREIDPLIASLKDPYYLVRSYSARALGKLKDVDVEKKSVKPLIEVLQNDEFFGARAEAAEALGTICRDDKSEVCKKAREALEKHEETVKKDKDERRWRAKREVERALQEIKETMKNLKDLDSKISQPDFNWNRESKKIFHNTLNNTVSTLSRAYSSLDYGARFGT